MINLMQYDQGRMGAKYQWSPDPVLAAVVGVVTVIIVLIPAVCSVCFRIHLRRHQPDQVLRWVVNGLFTLGIGPSPCYDESAFKSPSLIRRVRRWGPC